MRRLRTEVANEQAADEFKSGIKVCAKTIRDKYRKLPDETAQIVLGAAIDGSDEDAEGVEILAE